MSLSRFGWYDDKKYELIYEPELSFFEQKLKEIFKTPFIKIETFERIFSDSKFINY